MKYLILLLLVCATGAQAQDKLPVVYLPGTQTLHFISPEPIQYVDISTKDIIGDLPLKNVLRLRLKDSVDNIADAIVTVAGEKFIAQYRIRSGDEHSPSKIDILPGDTKPLDIAGIGFSQNQLKSMALKLMSRSPGRYRERSAAFGIKAKLHNVYTAGDYIFLDIGYENKTNLRYDIDEFRFKIDDKKITKATNAQSVEIHPEYSFADMPFFKRHYRNVFVFKKLSFPGNKILHIELSEKQISGRIVVLTISYQDILEADTLPL